MRPTKMSFLAAHTSPSIHTDARARRGRPRTPTALPSSVASLDAPDIPEATVTSPRMRLFNYTDTSNMPPWLSRVSGTDMLFPNGFKNLTAALSGFFNNNLRYRWKILLLNDH